MKQSKVDFGFFDLIIKSKIKELYFKGLNDKEISKMLILPLKDITIYTKEPIFGISRKLKFINHKISKEGQSKYEKVFITDIKYIGSDMVVLEEIVGSWYIRRFKKI